VEFIVLAMRILDVTRHWQIINFRAHDIFTALQSDIVPVFLFLVLTKENSCVIHWQSNQPLSESLQNVGANYRRKTELDLLIG